MIEFLTLFLGLFSGPQTVELRVAEPVAAVELRLDGRAAGILTRAPWKLEVDFGPELAPQQLEAVARDAAGNELGRLRRWVNVGTGDAGAAGEQTAVAVVMEPGFELPAPEAMGSWFTGAAGQPLEVVAVENGGAEVRVIRDPAAQHVVDHLRKIFLLDEPEETAAGRQSALRGAFQLGAGTRLQFLSPRAVAPSRSARPTQLFGSSPSYPINMGVLRYLDQLGDTGLVLRLADAAALAGRELHATARRRAVVVLFHGASADESLHLPGQVRGYLARLQVPVFAWAIKPSAALAAWGGGHVISPAPEVCGPCGKTTSGVEAFGGAFAELRRHLERQRIVTLAGRHRPQDVGLRAPGGLRLAHELLAPPIWAPDAVAAAAAGRTP